MPEATQTVPPSSPDIKEELAAEAVKIVTGARRSAYGTPEQNFNRICRLWNEHLRNRGVFPAGAAPSQMLIPMDVAILMVLMKVARLAETPDHRDSVVDMLGYTLCYGEIVLPEPPQPTAAGQPFIEVVQQPGETLSEACARTWRERQDLNERIAKGAALKFMPDVIADGDL